MTGRARLVESRELAASGPVSGSPTVNLFELNPPLRDRFPVAAVYVWAEGPSLAMAAVTPSGEAVAGQFWSGPDGTDASALAAMGYEIETDG